MGTYTASDFMALFGGLPERGEAAVDPDDLRDAADDFPWRMVGDPVPPSRPLAPCGEPCGPEGCMRRGCPVAR